MFGLIDPNPAPPRPRKPRGDLFTAWLYVRAIVGEFRWTLAALGAAISVGALLYRFTPNEAYDGRCPTVLQSIYAAWMAMLSQPISAPDAWYLTCLQIIYPLVGFIIATNDDMANLEVALDARRMNPRIRVIMRLFDQQIADKISGAFMVDQAFSASALAAPMVAAMSLETKVLSTSLIAGIPHAACEVAVCPSSPWIGRSIAQVEAECAARILARTPQGGPIESPPAADRPIAAGDSLVIHAKASQLASVAALARPGRTAEAVAS